MGGIGVGADNALVNHSWSYGQMGVEVSLASVFQVSRLHGVASLRLPPTGPLPAACTSWLTTPSRTSSGCAAALATVRQKQDTIVHTLTGLLALRAAGGAGVLNDVWSFRWAQPRFSTLSCL